MAITERTYNIEEVITFSKTSGKYGGLSNMAPNFSLFVNEIIFSNVEILYHTLKFPLFPKIQEKLISLDNPMKAKLLSREYSQYVRQDWDAIKFMVMKWCLQVKLLQNYNKFSEILLDTGIKPIVEYSLKDSTWGAKPINDKQLKGKNALGRLLTEIREINIKNQEYKTFILPLDIPAFLIFNNPITKVYGNEFFIEDVNIKSSQKIQYSSYEFKIWAMEQSKPSFEYQKSATLPKPRSSW
ncbi:MAG: NADAR family protein [Raineya sp.]|jgi:hypothetical protein|nr:NADAR family protein [Raineya sp.]